MHRALEFNQSQWLKQYVDFNTQSYIKNKVTLNLKKPAHTGMCILELNNVIMYKFHYDYIENKYGNNSKLLFTGTDGLMYEIKTEDVYEDFRRNKEMFDFSNYSTKSKQHDDSNKLVIGKIKDEIAGVAIEEFIGLKPTIYSYLVDRRDRLALGYQS